MDAGPGDDSCPGFDANYEPQPNVCDLNTTGDEGDDIIYPGSGVDNVFGEQGFDTIVVTNDGAYDRLFCVDGASEPNLPPNGGRLLAMGSLDPLDDPRRCEVDVIETREEAVAKNVAVLWDHAMGVSTRTSARAQLWAARHAYLG
ncbi:hypothetical protein LQ940_05015 [Nocardioides sp. cx-173]|nr:hypothetical protein LQ940_05015 [Nocardioides sp. cx-173]